MQVRYALAEDPVPDGWACVPLTGWQGSQGRVLHVRRALEDYLDGRTPTGICTAHDGAAASE